MCDDDELGSSTLNEKRKENKKLANSVNCFKLLVGPEVGVSGWGPWSTIDKTLGT